VTMMIKSGFYAGVLVLLLVLRTAAAAEDPVFGDIYGEGGSPEFVEGEVEAQKQQGIVLPAYPDTDSRDLIEVDLLISRYPFRLFIDPASVSIGEDQVVRYTAIFKSRSGATNIFYEGMRCRKGEYRRYAFGSPDGFQLSANSRWRFIRSSTGGSDRYLKVLGKYFICPAPRPDKLAKLLRRLGAPNPDRFLYTEEE